MARTARRPCWTRAPHAPARPAANAPWASAAAGAPPATCTGTGTAANAPCSPDRRVPVRPARVPCRSSVATAASPATTTGTGPAASARRSGGSADGATRGLRCRHLSRLWARLPARVLLHAGALPDVRPVLAAARRRAPARAPVAGGTPAAPLYELRPRRARAARRPVPRLLCVSAPDRARATAGVGVALMDPPEGYVAVTCPVCGRGYQTLQAAPVPFCSVACADAVRLPATPPPEPPRLFRALAVVAPVKHTASRRTATARRLYASLVDAGLLRVGLVVAVHSPPDRAGVVAPVGPVGWPAAPAASVGGSAHRASGGASAALPATRTGAGPARSGPPLPVPARSAGSLRNPFAVAGAARATPTGTGLTVSDHRGCGSGRMASRPCRVCGRVFPPGYGFTAGRCRMCQMYWRRHGVERPPGPHPASSPRPCTHCGRLTTALVRRQCRRCYVYWQRHGVERPQDLRAPGSCQTCGRPVQSIHRGRCNACYQYWYRTGRERPAELWQR
jgi:hypothetical protein